MTLRWACLPAVVLALAACARGEAPDALVLHNGKVFTSDTVAPWVEAVLIRGERIAAAGTNDAVLAEAPPGARRLDLGGRTVVPGFNDAHDHILTEAAGVTVATVTDPLPEPSFGLVRDSLRTAARRTPAGTWLRVSVGERVLSDGAARRAALDAITADHPIVLEAYTGHGAIYNSSALRALGVDESVGDPLGGRFDRDRAGRLTGLVEEYARYARFRAPGPVTDSMMVGAFKARAAEVVAWGITSIQNMVTGMPPDGLARAVPALELPFRLRLVRLPLTTPAGRATAAWEVLESPPGSGVTVSGTKWILDGTPVERLAAMRAPYADRPGWYGRVNFPPDTLRAMLREALESNDQPLLHVSGDSAIGLALSIMAELAPDSVWQRLRPRLEHGDALSPDQYDLARRLGVIVVENPSHFALGPVAEARLGPARLATFQPMRSLLANGIVVALGSDGPVNPFLNLMFATSHPNNSAEALSMDQAVRAYTWGSAVAEHAEGEKGRLAPGQLADLAVLSQDIFTVPPSALPATVSVLTIVGGMVVYDPEAMLAARVPTP